MAVTGARTKSMAVNLALREFVRRAELIRLTRDGLGLTPRQLRSTVDSAYDLETMRGRELPARKKRNAHSREFVKSDRLRA